MSGPHGPEMAATERPPRALELAIRRLSDLNQMADNLAHRMEETTIRMVHGAPPPAERELANVAKLEQPDPPGPELSELNRRIDHLERHLHRLMDTVTTIETV